MASSQKKRRIVEIWNSRRVTMFYPQYGEGRDRVTPVSAVRSSPFQEVIARYNLSSTSTRDEGVGPMFEETVYDRPKTRPVTKDQISAKEKEKKASTPPDNPNARKIRTDKLV